jgi:hypothetical protein
MEVFMKLFKTLTMTCAACLLYCSIVSAKEEHARAKIYVPKEAIHLTDKGAVVYINHVPRKVKTLHSDEKGFYFFEHVYECPECGQDPDEHPYHWLYHHR